MTWTKLSDDFSDDCWTLSDAAFRLHTEALVWSNRKLLDLMIPRDDLARFSRRPEAAAELIAVGWWSEEGDAYVIRHHAAYQRTRAAVVKQQEANRENGTKGGRPPKPVREQAGSGPGTDSVTQSVTESHGEPLSERDRTGQDWHQGRDVAASGVDPWAVPANGEMRTEDDELPEHAPGLALVRVSSAAEGEQTQPVPPSLAVLLREVGQPGDGGLACDGGVGPVVIVGVQPGR